ncbi:hypothetical protein BH09ACT2_BH09ACT2_20230 [soil metagenome]
MPNQGPILVQTFLDDIQGIDADDLGVWRLGFKFNHATERELNDRISQLLVEFKDRGPDADGRPLSIMVAVHPEQRKLPGPASPEGGSASPTWRHRVGHAGTGVTEGRMLPGSELPSREFRHVRPEPGE